MLILFSTLRYRKMCVKSLACSCVLALCLIVFMFYCNFHTYTFQCLCFSFCLLLFFSISCCFTLFFFSCFSCFSFDVFLFRFSLFLFFFLLPITYRKNWRELYFVVAINSRYLYLIGRRAILHTGAHSPSFNVFIWLHAYFYSGCHK